MFEYFIWYRKLTQEQGEMKEKEKSGIIRAWSAGSAWTQVTQSEWNFNELVLLDIRRV